MPDSGGGYTDADKAQVSCRMPDIARYLFLAFDPRVNVPVRTIQRF